MQASWTDLPEQAAFALIQAVATDDWAGIAAEGAGLLGEGAADDPRGFRGPAARGPRTGCGLHQELRDQADQVRQRRPGIDADDEVPVSRIEVRLPG